jgi:hypothetical protein
MTCARVLSVVLALSFISLSPSPAAAEPVKCRAAISAASAAFVQARTKILQKCREQVVQRKVSITGSQCAAEPKIAAKLGKAAAKLRTTIAKACGGKNKTCSAADAGVDADDAPGTVGFGASCPNFENGTCGDAIADCDDVASCVACVGSQAADQALGLSYDQLPPTDPKSKDGAERLRHKCQVAIGKHASKLAITKSKLLARCWKSVNKTGAGACPDTPTAAAIATARQKLSAALAKSCGGADGAIGGNDDVTPAAIGFPGSCLNAAVPACADTVTTLGDLAACVDCIAGFEVDCADAAAIPAFAAYPAKCNAGTKPPTLVTLNAVASGFYAGSGVHTAGNYAAGWFAGSSSVETRDYFVFDLTNVPGTIVAAYLRVSTAPEGSVRFGSEDPSETFTLFAVTTPIATLTGGSGGTAAFTDLGAGTTYGSVVATKALGATVDVAMNGSGIAFLQANRQPVAMGGAITTLAKGAASEFLFNATSAALTRQLVIATVE